MEKKCTGFDELSGGQKNPDERAAVLIFEAHDQANLRLACHAFGRSKARVDP